MIPDEADDLWIAYNLIAEGDSVLAVTVRYFDYPTQLNLQLFLILYQFLAFLVALIKWVCIEFRLPNCFCGSIIFLLMQIRNLYQILDL